ncbi:unnamed protein product [Rotaria socialis]|uniref:Uncharacterized protein n=1 Tax=Rotaria socialis TaxID=392032 RepID=A0A818XKP4_9BILA|nr:unnamed protein product [Rotaria socialis]CAF4501483.1 unnamed protein product [Rotaria socialis]
MSKVGSANIITQPRHYEIHNSFVLMGNERFLHEYKFEEGTCGCSSIYYTTITDTRLLSRSETTGCCDCGSQPDHLDASIFLRDIVEIREAIQTSTCCCCSFFARCCRCCRPPSSAIQIRGTFGSQIVHILKEDMPDLQVEMPAAIANHKLVSHH